MCDTLGKILSPNLSIFAKNSDRSPNEPQITEFRPAKENKKEKIRLTYLEIEQAEHTYANIISRPVWMWGAEMGVNEHGLCIGNEAVFTKGKYAKNGLIGMDMLRLALERCNNSYSALEYIINLLEEFGQGGDCGYDHKFFYDNAFFIMDKSNIYVLQTSGKNWVYKKVKEGSISNRLSINLDGDAYSGNEKYDFAKRHSDPLFSHFSGSKNRLSNTLASLNCGNNVGDMMTALRSHRLSNKNMLAAADVASPCMHAGGLVGDHTTASMIVEIGENIDVWLTGSSTPCISLFKPWRFSNNPIPPIFRAEDISSANSYWHYREIFHRNLIGHILPEEYYKERDSLEKEWLTKAQDASDEEMKALSFLAKSQEEEFYKKWAKFSFEKGKPKHSYKKYWAKKTKALENPARLAILGG